jgi:hypothetical protein
MKMKMKMTMTLERTTALALLLAVASPGGCQTTFEFSGLKWTSTATDAVVEEYLGREALRMRSGAAVLPEVELRNGVIEFDVATTGHRSFVGAAFRLRQDPEVEYEHFYLRPHQTGRFDATQYTPEIGGLAAWQLYPEYNAPVDIPVGEWIHVRLALSGSRLEAWVGDAPDATLVVEDLRLGGEPGGFALTSNFPEAASLDLYPTAFSNVVVTPDDEAPATQAEETEEALPGTVTEWALSGSVPSDSRHVTTLLPETLEALSWDVVSADRQGRVNVAEHRRFAEGAREGRVYASVSLHADARRVVPLGFGFSDRGSVFLNGRLLFTADNTYRSRSGRYLGVLTVDNDTLYLPLEAGVNRLVFAVTEAFGGWGFVARLGETEGIRVIAEPPAGP